MNQHITFITDVMTPNVFAALLLHLTVIDELVRTYLPTYEIICFLLQEATWLYEENTNGDLVREFSSFYFSYLKYVLHYLHWLVVTYQCKKGVR